jgi:hypothetical protein
MMVAGDAAIMPDSQPEVIKAHCPKCGAERNAFLRGKHVVRWTEENSPVSSSDTGMILECCGCQQVFFRRDYWFSEWETIGDNPYTGQPQLEGGVDTTYWPTPVQRKPPEWIDKVAKADRILGKLLSEMYAALNNDLRVLAAIGARTSFDRSSELLGVKSTLRFDQKLDELVSMGKVGKSERDTLEVLVDAGSAAAHRGWAPKTKELRTMMAIVEAFLYREFVLGDRLKKLKAAVPPKPSRPKKSNKAPFTIGP